MAKSKKRTLALMRPEDPHDPSAGYGSLGTPSNFLEAFERYNTAPDGSVRGAVGTEVLYGPGYVVEYQSGAEDIRNAMVTVNDQDCAWPVLQKVCKAYGWRMQDMESGQTFG